MSEQTELSRMRSVAYHERKIAQSKQAQVRQAKSGKATDSNDWKIEVQYHESMIQKLGK